LALNKREGRSIKCSWKEVLRRFFEPVEDGEMWRLRYNSELSELLREPDVIVVMKIVRLRWAGI
jgi:hypothetical protein